MRQIKFRGKRVDNGEWVYGGFHRVSDDIYMIIHHHFNNLAMNSQVIPESVGQFTGLTDKNGVEAYEGDKVPMYFEDVSNQDFITKEGIICFKFGSFMVYFIHPEEGNVYALAKEYVKGKLITGNIHENKKQ
jgi:uncharacterized phage protein (TIGR01671 family)